MLPTETQQLLTVTNPLTVPPMSLSCYKIHYTYRSVDWISKLVKNEDPLCKAHFMATRYQPTLIWQESAILLRGHSDYRGQAKHTLIDSLECQNLTHVKHIKPYISNANKTVGLISNTSIRLCIPLRSVSEYRSDLSFKSLLKAK